MALSVSRKDRLSVPETSSPHLHEGTGLSQLCQGCSCRPCVNCFVDQALEEPGPIDNGRLSYFVQCLSSQEAVRLIELLQQLYAQDGGINLPSALDKLVKNDRSLDELRSRLADVAVLSDLITDPPVIFIDQCQRLFFYRNIPILLPPISFRFMLFLAYTPKEFFLREAIYNHLWPGEMDYQGTNKPYERQISDTKRKLIAQIKRGIMGRAAMEADEMETLITTRYKVGYRLNVRKKDIRILGKDGLLWMVLSFVFDWVRLSC